MNNKFSTVMTSQVPAFQECTGSCHENVPTQTAASSDLGLTHGLIVFVRIEIVTITRTRTLPENISYRSNKRGTVFRKSYLDKKDKLGRWANA